jgi:hypothetical protein
VFNAPMGKELRTENDRWCSWNQFLGCAPRTSLRAYHRDIGLTKGPQRLLKKAWLRQENAVKVTVRIPDELAAEVPARGVSVEVYVQKLLGARCHNWRAPAVDPLRS